MSSFYKFQLLVVILLSISIGHSESIKKGKSGTGPIPGTPVNFTDTTTGEVYPAPPKRADSSQVGPFKEYEQVAKIADKIGGDYGRGLKEYLSIIGISNYQNQGQVALQNKGIQSYFQRLYDKNPCLQERAQKFYAEIKEIDRRWSNNNSKEFFSEDKMGGRATLDDTAGGEAFPQTRAGWVWNLAKKYSGDDPNFAMTLIGMCGHDDVARDIRHPLDGPASEYYKRKKVRELRRGLVQEQNKGDPDNLAYHYRHLIKTVRSKNTDIDISDENLCPKHRSSFFVAQSLDKDADISKDLKSEIAKELFKGKPRDKESKYYHIYGSAFMTCKLIENGMPAAMAKRVEMFAAWLYRSINFQNFQCLPNERAQTTTECGAIEDAKLLLGKWAIGGIEFFGIPIPYTNISPLPLKRIAQYSSKSESIDDTFYKLIKPAFWSDERFQAASTTVKNMLIDWEWTVTQHEKGAEFAASQCKPKPPAKDSEIISCPPLSKGTNTSDPSSAK